MKTEVVHQASENEKFTVKNAEEQKIVRGVRRSLQILQQEAGDKENLVGAGRLTRTMAPNKSCPQSLDVNKKQKTIIPEESSGISITDLTTEEPSKAYWEVLAERRRIALEDALQENEQLHQRIAFLEEENEQCKILLEETRSLVENLTEILNTQEDDEARESPHENQLPPEDSSLEHNDDMFI